MSSTASATPRSKTLSLIVGLVFVCIGAVAAGLLSMVLAAAGDGVAPDDYDAGNRAALLALFAASSSVAFAAGLAAFWLAWTARRPGRLVFSMAVTLSTCAVVVAVVPWLWNR